MSRLQNNPNLDLSKLNPTGISFQISADSIFFSDESKESKTTLEIQEKGWRKTISGKLPNGDTLCIEAVGKKPLHKSILLTLAESKDRSSSRVIELNGKKIGVLEECISMRNSLWIHSFPYHHAMKDWETLYYDASTKDVQIFYKGGLYGAAKYTDGTYQLLITNDKPSSLCLALSLAAIDAKDNRYTRFGK